MEPQMEMGQPEQEGRGGDTVMAHMSLGELVIPRAFLDDPNVMQAMQELFKQAGANINQYIVGDPANSINPDTGYPEFGFFKSIGKVFKKAAGFVLPNLGALGGFTNGLVQGDGLKGAIKGGINSGINTAISMAVPSVLSTLQDTQLGRGIGDLLGSSGGPLNGVDAAGKALQGPTQASGIRGAISGISNAIPAGNAVTGAGSSAYGGSTIGNVLGAVSSISGQDEAAKKLLEQQRQSQANFTPLLNQQWNPGDLTQDPGYQFQLQQGEQALARKNAATGNTFSGAALKDASSFNQGLAGTTAQDSYNRWLSTQNNKLAAAGGAAGTYDNIGNIQANKINANSNTFNDTLSRILGGGAVSQAAPDGYEYVNGVLKKKVTA